jgi:hypothetical protein
MSKLSQELRVERGDSVRFDEFSNVIQCFSGETGKVRDYTPDRNQEWFLMAKIQVTFWANQAQRNDAENDARRALMHYLYSDVLCELAVLRMAVSAGDRRKCFAALDQIDKTLMGDQP